MTLYGIIASHTSILGSRLTYIPKMIRNEQVVLQIFNFKESSLIIHELYVQNQNFLGYAAFPEIFIDCELSL